jgi:hypothetical protein
MEKKRIKVRYTVVIEIDKESDTDAFHDSLTSEMLDALRVRGCTVVVGETSEIFTVTRLDRLQ